MIVAAADGSALGNPGPAGWGWYVDDEHWAAGGWPHGTNNMGELTAVLDLLQQTAHLDEELTVLCDSTYVINSITKWMAGWKRKGWRKGDGKPVMNVEIMKAIDAAMAGRRVEFQWVKGHAGHELNERADKLANGAALAYQAGRMPEGGPGFGASAASVAGEEPSVATPSSAGDSLFDLADIEDSAPASDEDLVIDLERSLLTDAVRRDPDALARLLAPGWCEYGSSGRVVERDEILVDGIGPAAASLDVQRVERLADGVILLLWRSVTDRGSALRSSVWVRNGRTWRQAFHQGTIEH